MAQAMVRQFMVEAQQECPPTPIMPDLDTAVLRHKLIHEETQELCVAINRYFAQAREETDAEVLTEVADALADLLYVVLGAGVAFGINLEPVFNEVHASNMSKFVDGQRRPDGKWLKGPSWRPPNLSAIIEAQMD